MNLFELVDNVKKGDKHSLELVIDMFEPKINILLHQTNRQNREDLRQELYSVIIKKSKEYNLDKVPGLDEFIKKNIV
ncbi:MAG: helix-turn-helix domain-containing protein [Vulcanibacillus sp.]